MWKNRTTKLTEELANSDGKIGLLNSEKALLAQYKSLVKEHEALQGKFNLSSIL
jgi:hypothetical protein